MLNREFYREIFKREIDRILNYTYMTNRTKTHKYPIQVLRHN